MNLDHYEYYRNDDFLDFEFFSEGPKGIIKKTILFSPININGKTYFNVAFGDINELNNKIYDLASSNNGDRDKILATVARAILDFTEAYPDMIVFARGSTPSRTRLYQMGITNNWTEVDKFVQVYGYLKTTWHAFEKGIHYEALMIIRKK